MTDVTHEPSPVTTNKPAVPVTTRVIQDLRDKSEAGVAKYGVPLHTFNGRKPLRDAYQEALDLAQYLKQALMEEDIESGADEMWVTDIDLALGDQHYKDLVRIRDLERAMARQSADHAFELEQQRLRALQEAHHTEMRMSAELQRRDDDMHRYALRIEELEEDLKAVGKSYNGRIREDEAKLQEQRNDILLLLGVMDAVHETFGIAGSLKSTLDKLDLKYRFVDEF